MGVGVSIVRRIEMEGGRFPYEGALRSGFRVCAGRLLCVGRSMQCGWEVRRRRLGYGCC